MTPRRTTSCPDLPRWLALAGAILLAAACTPQAVTPPQEGSSGVYKVGKPYQVAGQWYYPKVDYAYSEKGLASWYGPSFHGRRTANGEMFDMDKVSGAHKTLPLPSIVRVTNLENGRSLVVRVNDRGPFIRGRIIDLSKKAAELLGFAEQGTAPVKVELLVDRSRQEALALGAASHPEFGPPPPKAAPSVEVTVETLGPLQGTMMANKDVAAEVDGSVRVAATAQPGSRGTPPPYDGMTDVGPRGRLPAAAESERGAAPDLAGSLHLVPVTNPPSIYIQAGAFARFDNANRLRVRLGMLGYPVRVHQVYITNQPMFRVRVGPLQTVEAADRTLDRLVAAGYPDAQIVID